MWAGFDGFRTFLFDAYLRDGFILGTSTWFAPSLAMGNEAGTRKFPTSFLKLWTNADPDIPSTGKPRQSPHSFSELISATQEEAAAIRPERPTMFKRELSLAALGLVG